MDLSEQEMMDCSEGYKNTLHGCRGGDTCTALDWMLTVRLHMRGRFWSICWQLPTNYINYYRMSYTRVHELKLKIRTITSKVCP